MTAPLTVAPACGIAVHRPSSGEWLIREVDGSETRVVFGAPDDRPVPANYLGTGKKQVDRFRPATQIWLIRDNAGVIIPAELGVTLTYRLGGLNAHLTPMIVHADTHNVIARPPRPVRADR